MQAYLYIIITFLLCFSTSATAQTTFQHDTKGNQVSGSYAGSDLCLPDPPPVVPFNINIDGNVDEWGEVPVLSSAGSGGLNFLKVYDDCHSIYLYADGHLGAHFQVYIDADIQAGGGAAYQGSPWFSGGFGYLLEDGFLYRYTGDGSNWSWSAVSTEAFAISGDQLELRIRKSRLTDLGTGIRLGFAQLDANWATTGKLPDNNTGAAYTLVTTAPCAECTGDFLVLSGTATGSAYHSTNSGISSTQQIQSGADVVYNAATYIRLDAGFAVRPGAAFSAYIDGCEAAAAAIGPPPPASAKSTGDILQLDAYPNPFSRQLHLRIVAPEAGYYSVVLYDLLGRAVAQPSRSEWRERGAYTLTLDPAPETGVLVVRLWSASGYSTERMVVRESATP